MIYLIDNRTEAKFREETSTNEGGLDQKIQNKVKIFTPAYSQNMQCKEITVREEKGIKRK